VKNITYILLLLILVSCDPPSTLDKQVFTVDCSQYEKYIGWTVDIQVRKIGMNIPGVGKTKGALISQTRDTIVSLESHSKYCSFHTNKWIIPTEERGYSIINDSIVTSHIYRPVITEPTIAIDTMSSLRVSDTILILYAEQRFGRDHVTCTKPHNPETYGEDQGQLDPSSVRAYYSQPEVYEIWKRVRLRRIEHLKSHPENFKDHPEFLESIIENSYIQIEEIKEKHFPSLE